MTALLAAAMLTSVGCANGGREGFDDTMRTQLQFYSPPGAAVAVRADPPHSMQIAPETPFGDRLERWPEESSTFNLPPGCYQFKYTSADGLPGMSVYGELVVHFVFSKEARMFRRLAFVPIELPSEYYMRNAATGDDIFPYRAERYRTAISELDLERLKLGDVVEKVFFVADLEKVKETLKETEVDIAVTERKIERAEARFRNAYLDFHADVNDPWARFWGTDEKFIKREKELQKLYQELEELLALRDRADALLNADNVLVRNGMLVLATQEIIETHRDPVDAAQDLGEVLLVMRVGGRHMQWRDPAGELISYER